MRLNQRLGLLRSVALRESFRQILTLRQRDHSPWHHGASPGYQRGIDFYRPIALVSVMATAMRHYHRRHGCYPNIVEPAGFNEKVFWFKFFGELKVPESGDKLSTHRFIPDELRDRLQCAPLVWQGITPELPANDAIAPGVYYLKVNLGSGMFKRITYPLCPDQRSMLEFTAAQWLCSRYGLNDGEWWYNVFEPRLLLEHSVSGNADPISWNVYVLNGHIPMVGMFVKHADGSQSSSWLDETFRPLPWRSTFPPVRDYRVPENHVELIDFARRIARPFVSVRVDFLQGEDGKIYLCELTFSPGNALSRRPPEVDALLSAPWKVLQ